eukprot:318754_1
MSATLSNVYEIDSSFSGSVPIIIRDDQNKLILIAIYGGVDNLFELSINDQKWIKINKPNPFKNFFYYSKMHAFNNNKNFIISGSHQPKQRHHHIGLLNNLQNFTAFPCDCNYGPFKLSVIEEQSLAIISGR